MKKTGLLFLFALLFLFSCNKLDDGSISDGSESFSSLDGISSSGNGNGNGEIQPGMITAGEWNDLENWDFWQGLMQSSEYEQYQQYWEIYPVKRYRVKVQDMNNHPVTNTVCTLIDANENNIWSAKTDAHGFAELWNGFFTPGTSIHHINIQYPGYESDLNPVLLYSEGTNEVIIDVEAPSSDVANILFVVDATGSMGDEINYLKTELKDIIQRSDEMLQNMNLSLGAIFYRDQGDDYLTVSQNFTTDANTIVDFVNEQDAAGGGDYPEAVHSALEVAKQFNWDPEARARILFLLLDAPPHYEGQIIDQIHEQIKSFAKQGIKIIPVSASGINKETEFLLRFMALGTNGTYTFITNDSGIGNDHIEPSIGDFQHEYLNDLLVRIIKENCSF